MKIAQINEKLKRHSKLKVEEMTCWARFKYSEKQPSFRVHIWDIFDQASLETRTFEAFFEKIFEKLS